MQDNRTGGLSSTRHQLYKDAENEARELKAKQQADNAAKVLAQAEASPAPVETEATAEPVKPTRKRKAKAEASDSVGESTEATAE